MAWLSHLWYIKFKVGEEVWPYEKNVGLGICASLEDVLNLLAEQYSKSVVIIEARRLD